VSVLVSATGVRIDCDRCGQHVSSSDLSVDALRRASGFVYTGEADYCPSCAGAEPRGEPGAG
jgi:hypothetical protein